MKKSMNYCPNLLKSITLRWLLSCTLLLFLILFPGKTFAGDTGKISGKVKSDSGEPLPGANVILVGTSMGAAADLNGNFDILHIRPGTYNVRVSMIGYETVLEKDVEVSADRTIFLNFTLRKTEVKEKEIVVTARREVIKADVSSTQYSFGQKEAEVLPVNTIQDVLNYQLGVSVSGDDISIRGGSSDQINFLLNGLSLSDEMFNRPYMALNMTDVSQIQIITSGFNAEYGDIRSGLVKVITKEGSDQFHASFDYKILPYEQKYNGPDILGPNSLYNLIYASPISMDSAAVVNTFPYESNQYGFYGWPVESKTLLTDKDSTNDLTPKQVLELWKWQYRGLPVRHEPDQYLDGTISGPFPFRFIPFGIGNIFDKTTFVLSHRYSYVMFPTPSVRDHYYDRNTQLQFTNKDIQNININLTALWGYEYGIGSADIQGDLDVLRGGGSPYTNADVPTADLYTTLYGLKVTHFLTPVTYYEAQLSYMNRRYYLEHGPARDTSSIFEVPSDWYVLPSNLTVPGYWDNNTGHYVTQNKTFMKGDSLWVPPHWYDESPYGWVVPGPETNSIDGRSNLDVSNGNVDVSSGSSWHFKFDLSSQIDHENLIKTGVELDYDVFHRRYYSIRWMQGTQKILYDDYPQRGAFYVQDKYERQGLIANVGVRVDYFNPNALILSPSDPFSPYFTNVINFYTTLDSIPKGPSKKFLKISPRLGVSFPISISSKIYFNYGHFYSLAPSQYMFGYLNSPNGRVEQINNPSLDLPETISYEVGYEQALADQYLMHLSFYYKDVTNQPGQIQYINGSGTISYRSYSNTNYEDILGLELRIEKNYGDFFSGWIQTQFYGSNSGYIGMSTIFPANSNILNQFYTPQYAGKFLWNWTPSFLANIDIHTPMDWGPEIFGSKLLGGWRFNIIQSWSEGAPYTWNPLNDPRIINNLRWVNNYDTDIKFSKSIEFSKNSTATLYLDIRNLFTRKVLSPGALYGPGDDPISEQYQYFNSLIQGQDRVGDYKAAHIKYPRNTPGRTIFSDPNGIQTIYFGIRFNI